MAKRKLIVLIIALLTILIIILTNVYMAINVYPYNVKKTTYKIQNTKIPTQFHNFTIAVFSDLYLDDQEDYKRFNKAVKLIPENTDLVVFIGDIFEKRPVFTEQLINDLSKIKPKYGKFAILGEKDLILNDEVSHILKSANFEILVNAYRPIYFKNEQIIIHGLDFDGYTFNTELEKFYNIAFIHEPDLYDNIQHMNFDLQISAHGHGGYIKLPFRKAMYPKAGASVYPYGFYNRKLIVTSGVGMENKHSIRWGTSNEIIIIELK